MTDTETPHIIARCHICRGELTPNKPHECLSIETRLRSLNRTRRYTRGAGAWMKQGRSPLPPEKDL